jgi:hypothetical protein
VQIDYGSETAVTLEFTHRLAGAEKLTGQVDADHGVPLIQRHLFKRRVFLQTGVPPCGSRLTTPTTCTAPTCSSMAA